MQAKSENDEARSVLGTTGEPLTNQRKDRIMAESNPIPTLAPIPLTAGEVRRWAGSDFCSLKYGRDDQLPDENDTYSMTAHDIISAFVNMGEIWPIARIKVSGDEIMAKLYAPGLPDGEHDVYPTPMMSDGEVLERNAEEAERNRIINVLKALRPAEPNCVWESAYQHVIDECVTAIVGASA